MTDKHTGTCFCGAVEVDLASDVAADAAIDRHFQHDSFAPQVEQRRVDESEQIGRNDPCWCGSGKKFKKCHGA